jgi:hypothetical protein
MQVDQAGDEGMPGQPDAAGRGVTPTRLLGRHDLADAAVGDHDRMIGQYAGRIDGDDPAGFDDVGGITSQSCPRSAKTKKPCRSRAFE